MYVAQVVRGVLTRKVVKIDVCAVIISLLHHYNKARGDHKSINPEQAMGFVVTVHQTRSLLWPAVGCATVDQQKRMLRITTEVW